MLYARQRLLLTLLYALKESIGNTDFQKLLFLYTHEYETEPSYEYVPYRFGGFSFTSYADKRKLTALGLLADNALQWELTERGRREAQTHSLPSVAILRFCRERANLRGNALIAEQYRKYPYYAIRSEIIDKINLTTEEMLHISNARPVKQKPGLLTIGYEGKSLEFYLNQLIRSRVSILCDVRRNPISRKYGFSKSTLSKACEGLGIKYEHLPELGIASEERRDLKTQNDYDALFKEYETKHLPVRSDSLSRIRNWVEDGERVALTCYEALPCQCHRHCVAEALERTSNLVSRHL